MSLSENIKELRTKKGLTQEQLAEMLGVSAQAVSKWERCETYPDGSLLVPLASKLEVSLDRLFDNDNVYMSDVSAKIKKLLYISEDDKRFDTAYEICWQIEKGLFASRAFLDEEYAANSTEKIGKKSSYIFTNGGFTHLSNGDEPFFAIFPEPDDGYGHFSGNIESITKIFSALSHKETMDALMYLYGKTDGWLFEKEVLAKECDIPSEKTDDVINELRVLKAVRKQELAINGANRTLYLASPSHKILALLIIANEVNFCGSYTCQSHTRTIPLIKPSK